jgi:hypothetical protein
LAIPSINLAVSASRSQRTLEIAPLCSTMTGASTGSFPASILFCVDADKQIILITFEFFHDPHVEQNTYTHDNSAMWNQEVFEVFISAGAETPMRYLEIELNPNGALFSAWVTNPDGTGRNNVVDFFAGRNAGIQTSVVKGENFWHGKIIIPLSLLGSLQEHYRLNFFRIVSLQPHDPESSWSCTAESCAFLAWSPTFSGDVPNFHIPACFGHLNLK